MSDLFTDVIKTDIEAQRRNRAWIEALRSGRYQQGRRSLALLNAEGRRESYCCLGVACDLVVPEGIGTWDGGTFECENDEGSNDLGLPACAQTAYRLRDSEGAHNYDTTSLSHLNDSGEDFEAIADVIERELNEAMAS